MPSGRLSHVDGGIGGDNMKSRLLRFCFVALAAFAIMPAASAMALDSKANVAVDGGPCTFVPCIDPLCLGGPTWTVCVLNNVSG